MNKIIITVLLSIVLIGMDAKKKHGDTYSKPKKSKKQLGVLHTIGSEVSNVAKQEGKKIVDHVHQQAQQAITDAIDQQTKKVSHAVQDKVNNTAGTIAYHAQPIISKIHNIIQGGIYYTNAGIYHTGAAINKGVDFITRPLDPYRVHNVHDRQKINHNNKKHRG